MKQIITADADELLAVLSSLTESARRVQQALNRLVDLREFGSELAHIELADLPADGTGVRVLGASFKPSDRLLKLSAALQACERELLIAKDVTHGQHVCGSSRPVRTV